MGLWPPNSPIGGIVAILGDCGRRASLGFDAREATEVVPYVVVLPMIVGAHLPEPIELEASNSASVGLNALVLVQSILAEIVDGR